MHASSLSCAEQCCLQHGRCRAWPLAKRLTNHRASQLPQSLDQQSSSLLPRQPVTALACSHFSLKALVAHALPNGSGQPSSAITHTLQLQEVPGLSPQEQTLVDQLQMLLEINDTDSAQAPALIQQMGMQLITTSMAANSPTPSMTDTMAEEAEQGGGDGMTVPMQPSDVRASPGPTGSVLAALNKVAPDGEEDGMHDSTSFSGRVGIGGLGRMDQGMWGWGQSALQQLHARKVFMNVHAPKPPKDDGSSKGGAKAGGAPKAISSMSSGKKDMNKKGPEMRFDPMDTLEDDGEDENENEESFGIEGGVSPLMLKGQQGGGVRLWGVGKGKHSSKGGVSAAGFFGSMSSKFAAKVASKVGGLGQKVKETTDPLTSRVQQNADAAAAAITSASSLAAQRLQPLGKSAEVAGKAVAAAAAAAGAVAASSPAVVAAAAAATAAGRAAANATAAAAAAAAAAARSAPAKLLGGAGSAGTKSSWVVVDAPSGTMFPSASHTVRVVVITASPELVKSIKKMQQQQSTTGLVSFESYKLGVKVPKLVYTEASSLYTTLLPLIIDFVAESPKGRVCFTGTGAGGSLATVLGLMAASRGLRPHCMSPLVVALDSPPVLAEVISGALWGCGGQQQEACGTADWNEMVVDITARGLLSELGLPHNAVLNVRTSGASDVPTPSPMSATASGGVAAGMAAGVGSVVSKAKDAIPQPAAIVSASSHLVAAAVAGATSKITHMVAAAGTAGTAASSSGSATTVPGSGVHAGAGGPQAAVPGGPVPSASDAVTASMEEGVEVDLDDDGSERGSREGAGAEGRYARMAVAAGLGKNGRGVVAGRDGSEWELVSGKTPQHETLSLFKLVGEVRVQA